MHAPMGRDRHESGQESLSFGFHAYRLCCPSGDCDTTMCANEGAHVECTNGKANAICDTF